MTRCILYFQRNPKSVYNFRKFTSSDIFPIGQAITSEHADTLKFLLNLRCERPNVYRKYKYLVIYYAIKSKIPLNKNNCCIYLPSEISLNLFMS